MSIIFSSTIAKITMDKLKRVCPSCGKKQSVPRDRLHDSVKCRFCRAEIPAKK